LTVIFASTQEFPSKKIISWQNGNFLEEKTNCFERDPKKDGKNVIANIVMFILLFFRM
jgi:hypothetical protein